MPADHLTVQGAAAPPSQPERAADAGRPRFYLTNEFGLLVLIARVRRLFRAAHARASLSAFNLFTLGRTAAINIMIGFSMMAVIVTGGLNLSVGAIGVCAAMAFGWLIERAGLPLAARHPRRARAWAPRSAFVNGWADRPLRPAQLHHHARDDEHLLRRDGLPHPRPVVPRAAARCSPISAG